MTGKTKSKTDWEKTDIEKTGGGERSGGGGRSEKVRERAKEIKREREGAEGDEGETKQKGIIPDREDTSLQRCGRLINVHGPKNGVTVSWQQLLGFNTHLLKVKMGHD